MYRGRIIGIVPPSTSRDQIGLMMAGVEDGADDGRTDGAEERPREADSPQARASGFER